MLHVALVAPHYFVGSFDDDAAYVLGAKGLLRGVGLTGRLPSGEVLVGLFPPGYSALLAPLVWIWPHSFVPLRLFSVTCYCALFPLTWIWLRRKGTSEWTAASVLVVLALGPPLATYASMVMAEGPFLVALILLLLAVDRWLETGVWSRWAAAVVALAAGLVWLKQAAIGLVAGLAMWLVLSPASRRWARTAVLVVGTGMTLAPVVAARLATGVPVAGARYSQELGGYYQGGLLRRLVDVVPGSTWHLLSTAIPATVVPYLEPLPIGGHWPDLWKVVSWHVTLLAVIGAAVWARRHHDATVPMVVVYLAESVLWPFVNERRAILVLPLLAAWYVTGAVRVWSEVRSLVDTAGAARRLRAAATLLAALVVALPLVAQMPRDYLFGWGQSGSRFGGSRYVSVLSHLGRPDDVVETDYRSSTALFTGHQTGWSAFTGTVGGRCYGPGVLDAMAYDRAGFLLLADVNRPGQIDSPCIQSQALLGQWAVQILHTNRDDASVYELIGPYTGHPGTVELLRQASTDRVSSAGRTVASWDLSQAEAVDQLSVGEAGDDQGATRQVRLEVRNPDGRWTSLAQAPSAVGDGPGRAPYLLLDLPVPRMITGVRVVVEGSGPAAAVTITDVVALGPSSGGS